MMRAVKKTHPAQDAIRYVALSVNRDADPLG